MPSASATIARGLELYAARWNRNTHDKPWDIPVPEWDGQPLDGRLSSIASRASATTSCSALLFSELRRYAKSITIEVNARIASLFRRSFPGHAGHRPQRAAGRIGTPASYHAKVGMGDLLSRLPVDLENLPNREGLLIPEPALALKLRNRYRALFPGKRLIGISWRSGNRDSATIRSIDLSLWKPIFETPDCAFISLQYGDIEPRPRDAARRDRPRRPLGSRGRSVAVSRSLHRADRGDGPGDLGRQQHRPFRRRDRQAVLGAAAAQLRLALAGRPHQVDLVRQSRSHPPAKGRGLGAGRRQGRGAAARYRHRASDRCDRGDLPALRRRTAAPRGDGAGGRLSSAG